MISPWHPHPMVGFIRHHMVASSVLAPRSHDEEATRASNSPYGVVPLQGIPEMTMVLLTLGFWILGYLENERKLWTTTKIQKDFHCMNGFVLFFWLDSISVAWCELVESWDIRNAVTVLRGCQASSSRIVAAKDTNLSMWTHNAALPEVRASTLLCLRHDISWRGLRN